MMYAAAYCRVSTDKDDQTNSLENQTTYFTREIEKFGYELYKVYPDQGLSGTKLSRPQFDALLYDAGIDIFYRDRNRKKPYFELSKRKPQFQKIFVKNTSRFARNILSYELISLLRQNNITIRFCEQNLDTGDVSQDFLIKLMQIFDEQDSKDKSSKIRWGNAESGKRNRVRSSRKLYGYEYSHSLKDGGKLVEIESEAKIVRLIFNMYLSGKGVRQVVDALDEMGIKTRSGKQFSRSTVKHILNNEKYAGLNNPLKYDCGQVLVNEHYPRPKDTYSIQASENINAIVSVEDFYKAKQIMESRVSAKQRGVYTGITKYAGLIKCGKCGMAYHSNMDNGRRFYNCSGKRSGNGCTNENVSEKRLDEALNALTINYPALINAQTAYALKYVVEKISKQFTMLDVDVLKTVREIDDRVASLRKEQQMYAELFATVESTRDVMKNKIIETDKVIAELEQKKKDISVGTDQIKYEIRKCLKAIEKLKKMIANDKNGIECNVLESVSTIFVNKDGCDKISFELKLDPEIDELLGCGWYDVGVLRPENVEDMLKSIDLGIVQRAVSVLEE